MRSLTSPLTSDPDNILVTALCPIGDTLFLTPALALLRERFRAARISVVVSPSNEGILLGNPAVDERILVPERGAEPESVRFARGVRRLSQERPDLIVNFSAAGSISSTLAGLHAPRLGLAMPPLWSVFGARSEAYRRRHAIDHYFKVIEPVVAPPSTAEARVPRFYISDEARREARKLLIADGAKPSDVIVTMHVGGDGFGGRKQWEPERFARVANDLVERFDAQIIIVGGKADLPMTDHGDRADSPQCALTGGQDIAARHWRADRGVGALHRQRLQPAAHRGGGRNASGGHLWPIRLGRVSARWQARLPQYCATLRSALRAVLPLHWQRAALAGQPLLLLRLPEGH